MKRSVQILLLLFLFALPAGAQDVVLKGGGDLHRLCEDETLKPESGWRIVHKNMSVGGLSPEDWYGIVKVEQKGGSYEATLAFGPVKCDGFSWVNDQDVAQFWRGRKTENSYRLSRILLARASSVLARRTKECDAGTR